MAFDNLKKMIKRKDGSYNQKGLWDNIRERDKKGLPNKKPKDKGYPDKDAFKKSQK